MKCPKCHSSEKQVKSGRNESGSQRYKCNRCQIRYTPEPAGFQGKVAHFVQLHGLQAPVPARVLDLVSEVGESSKEALKGSHYGRQPFRPTSEWADELGDVLFALTCVAISTGVDLEVALEETLEKYGQRLALKDDLGSGR